MKKSALFAGLALMTALSSVAAPLNFNVDPPAWKRVAESKNPEGVNIRKSPSTSAPRVMYDENKIDDYETPLIYYGFWSTLPAKGSRRAVTFTGPEAIVSERDGWYEVQNIGPKEESNGWVSAKVCNAVTPPPIKSNTRPIKPNLTWTTTGSDGEYCIYLQHDEMNGIATFYYGKLIDGVVVCPYSLVCDDAVQDENQNFGIFKMPEGYYVFRYNSKITTDGYEIDLSKFPTELLNGIINNAKPCKKQVVFINNDYYCITAY